jgi:hypothetical protein
MSVLELVQYSDTRACLPRLRRATASARSIGSLPVHDRVAMVDTGDMCVGPSYSSTFPLAGCGSRARRLQGLVQL